MRIAPSPTGFFHVGSARTALYNWLFARHHKGKYIVRVEDTDVKRSSKDMIQVILDGLSWLGLNWDEGPYYQSERLIIYKNNVQTLIDKGYAYFVHSFHALPEEDVIAATTSYGCDINAVVWRNNVFGTQFHPEKSGSLGLQILRNFLEL